MSEKNQGIPLPEVVKFEAEGVRCVAHVAFNMRGMTLRSCLINLGEGVPEISIMELEPNRTRLTIQLPNDGNICIDTSLESAQAIQVLFETGVAPATVENEVH